MSTKGVVVEPVYGQIRNYSEGLAAVEKDGKWGYLDTEGRIALPLEYDGAASFKGNYAKVAEGKRTYIIDRSGKEICDTLKTLDRGADIPLEGFFAGGKDGKYGLLDNSSHFVMPCDFDEIERWGYTRLIKVKKDDKYGIFDLSGKEIVRIGFDSIGDPVSGNLPVCICLERWEKEGIVSPEGKIVLDPEEFKSCSVDRTAGVITAKDKSGKTGLYRCDGSVIVPCELDRIGSFSDNGTAVAVRDGLSGILDREGNRVIPAEYQRLDNLGEGLAAAAKDGKWGFINDRNEWVILPAYDSVYSGFRSGYAKVMKDNKYILINSKGKELTKPAASLEIYTPADGMIRFKTGRKYGYLDTEGNIAIKPAFEEADDFENGCALVSVKVEKQPMWTFVTKDGMTHETFEDRVYNLGHLIPVEKEGKKALFRPDGTLAVPFVLKKVPRVLTGVSAIQFV